MWHNEGSLHVWAEQNTPLDPRVVNRQELQVLHMHTVVCPAKPHHTQIQNAARAVHLVEEGRHGKHHNC